MTLDEFRPILESAAESNGLALDFLMKTWNGRFATFNVGIPTVGVGDPRRGVRGDARHYRLLGRVKVNTQGGELHVTMSPPSACDVTPTDADQATWGAFAAALQARLS